MNNKILRTIFLVLFIVLLAEVGYLVFSNKPKGISAPNINKEISAPNTNKAYIQADTENSEYLVQLFKKTLTFQEKEFYRNIFSLNYPKSLYGSLILKSELDGKISNISSDSGQFNPVTKYSFKFDLTMADQPKPLPIYYSAEDLSKIKVMKKVNDKDVAGSLQDLKDNDSVSIIETFDLKEFKLIEADITKN